VTEHESLWDARKLGLILKGAITESGYARVQDLIVDMERQTGVRRHDNTIYDILGGKRLPDLEVLTAMMIVLGIKHSRIAEAVNESSRDAYMRLIS